MTAVVVDDTVVQCGITQLPRFVELSLFVQPTHDSTVGDWCCIVAWHGLEIQVTIFHICFKEWTNKAIRILDKPVEGLIALSVERYVRGSL